MRTLVIVSLLLMSCGDSEIAPETDTDTDTDSDTDTDTDTDTDEEPHPIGMDAPAFALEDLNPDSQGYGQIVDSATLDGRAYALVFLDSQCSGCPPVAEDLYAELVARPHWADAMPVYAVQSPRTLEHYPHTTELMFTGHGLPYLADDYETNLWAAYHALNHDFFAIGAEGALEAWLPLYRWPEQLADYTAFMTERYGE